MRSGCCRRGCGGVGLGWYTRIVVLGDNECEVRMWACWSGILARGMKWSGFGKKVEARSREYVGEIKERAEQQARGGG